MTTELQAHCGTIVEGVTRSKRLCSNPCTTLPDDPPHARFVRFPC
jgi:hypothetical protein